MSTTEETEGLSRRTLFGAGAMLAAGLAAACEKVDAKAPPGVISGHATASDGHRVYYEVHGGPLVVGQAPMLLLHGGIQSIETAFKPDFIARFTRNRPVVAVDQQGHGHTADRDGPIKLERVIDDTAAVLDHLGVINAHVLGYSYGGMIATGLAIRHPAKVASASILAAGYRLDGFIPEIVAMQTNPAHKPSAEIMPLLPSEADFKAWQDAFNRNNPNPASFMTVLEKMNTMLSTWQGWTPAQLGAITARVLIGIGDNDYVRIEHAAEMKRLIPGAWLAVLPHTEHMTILSRADWLTPMIEERIAKA